MPSARSASSTGISTTSMPIGSPAIPCSRSTSATFLATSAAMPAAGLNAPRSVEMPARAPVRAAPSAVGSPGVWSSHGLYSWWCRAADPKSQITGSPPRGSSANLISLSMAQVPMCVAVMYLVLDMSKLSSPPSSDRSSSAFSLASRSARSRAKSTRSSQSTASAPNVRIAKAVTSPGIGPPCLRRAACLDRSAKIKRADLRMFKYLAAAALEPDPAVLEHHAVRGQPQPGPGVLLDKQDRLAARVHHLDRAEHRAQDLG